MKIAVTAESTIDLTKELLNQYDIKVLPFYISIGEQTFADGEMEVTKLFETVNKTNTLPKTSAHNQFEYTEFFTSVLDSGYDAIVHIALSGKITSSTQNAINAASELKNVFVIDSLSLSTGIALLAIYARQLTKTIDNPEQIYNLVKERTKTVQASFVIERLDYLYKGGRCTGFQLLGANVLKLRPRIILNEGKMESDKKYRGDMEFVIPKYCQDVLEKCANPDKSIAFITYTTATEKMVNSAKEALTNHGFKTIYETKAGTTIASHCGENTLGILFFNDNLTTL